MDTLGAVVVAVFIVTYVAISTEKVHRTAMSMLGMAIVGIILWIALLFNHPNGATFSELVREIEWHTLLFVTGQMIIVVIARASGMFQYLALRMAKSTGGDIRRLFITFLIFVFFISLFFDTTSTMLIVAPLTIEVCKAVETDYNPFLISEAVVANFASIPSIVGDVPNLVIASETNIDPGFMFIALIPLSTIYMIVSIPIFLRIFEKSLVTQQNDSIDHISSLDPQSMIHSKRDFYASACGMFCLVFAFTLGPGVHFEPALTVFTIASALLLLRQASVEKYLTQIGWGTILFLIGLFGLVAAFQKTGIIAELAVNVGLLIGENDISAIIFMTWFPAFISAIVDNVPVSAVLAPLAKEFAYISPILPLALVVAVNIGGFILPIGSPANVLAIAFSEREGNPIGLKEFAKLVTPLALLMMVIGTGWLLLLVLFI